MSEYTNLNPSGNTGFDIARLNIAEATTVNLFGYNPSVNATPGYETLWNFGGKYPINESAGVMSVSSSASGDSSLRVLVDGVDADYEPISEIVTLNAIDATTLVITNAVFLRINQCVTLDG